MREMFVSQRESANSRHDYSLFADEHINWTEMWESGSSPLNEPAVPKVNRACRSHRGDLSANTKSTDHVI